MFASHTLSDGILGLACARAVRVHAGGRMTGPIRVTVAVDNMATDAWFAALRDAFAEAGLETELACFDGSARNARYAVVWQPPTDLFRVETSLRAVFNTGAGVEWLLQMAALSPDVPLFRLVDAGMAPKMAEYVCFYVARITRGLDRFIPSQLVNWNVDKPRGTQP